MNRILEVNEDNWEREVLRSNTLVVVDFWHEECLWCKRLDPIYTEVSKEYQNRVKFAKLNVLENQSIAIEHGIMGTPTLVFFCEGRSLEAVAGFQTKEQLKHLVDDVISKHQECVKQSTALKP